MIGYILDATSPKEALKNSEAMASSSQEAHTHTQGEALSLSHSLIHRDMEAKAFSYSSSLKLLVQKKNYVTTHI